MKVLFLSQIVPYPPHGGVLQRGYNILRELGRGATVHLLAFVHPDVLPTESAVEESRRALQAFCERVEYFPLWAKASARNRAAAVAASACSNKPFSVIAHHSQAFRQGVARACETVPFDIVHVDTIALSQFIHPRPALPAVLTHHNVESMLMERRAQVESRRLIGCYFRRESVKLRSYEETVCPQFDMNIVMSPQDGDALTARMPELRTAVVPNGVDVDYFTPDPTQETPALIYAGGMNMFANRDAVMHFLRDIWPAIRRESPQARFFAVGQQPPPELLALAARDPHIVVTGYVEDVRPLVRQAAVYVVPLRVGGGTRLKVLDAMAAGKAIVSTSIGCEGIDVCPGRHLEIADTPATFVAKTVQLMRDRAARLTLGRAARELVEQRYAWPVVGNQLLDAYQGAIRLGGRG